MRAAAFLLGSALALGIVPAAADEPAPQNLPSPVVAPVVPDIAGLVARVRPEVVNVTTEHAVRAPRVIDPFEFFFGRRPGAREGEPIIKQQALGSGFIIDPTGHVVTNAHVVENADVVRVKLADDREFRAKVKGRDARLDLAVLELEGARDLPMVTLGSSDALRVGETVVAIGNPFGLGNTVTAGIVSAKSRTIGAGPYDDFIQTDASINPGNSGGPLFDLRGEVVGINTAIAPQGRGIGFAIPIDEVKQVLPQLLSTGHVSRGHLGVAIQAVDATMARALGLGKPRGALIGEVEKGGPADKAGLKAGDVIVGIGNVEVARAQDLPRIIASHPPGARVPVRIVHDKSERTAEVTLDALKEENAATNEPESEGTEGPASRGLQQSASELGIEVQDAAGGSGAVVRKVVSGGLADGSLERGDVIVELDRAPITGARDLERRIRATPPQQPLLFKVQREGRPHYVAIERK
jgi:serine protease Do